ncbi:hypothetical protein pb186bvf_017420 [Paramecium bursaria]
MIFQQIILIFFRYPREIFFKQGVIGNHGQLENMENHENPGNRKIMEITKMWEIIQITTLQIIYFQYLFTTICQIFIIIGYLRSIIPFISTAYLFNFSYLLIGSQLNFVMLQSMIAYIQNIKFQIILNIILVRHKINYVYQPYLSIDIIWLPT